MFLNLQANPAENHQICPRISFAGEFLQVQVWTGPRHVALEEWRPSVTACIYMFGGFLKHGGTVPQNRCCTMEHPIKICKIDYLGVPAC